MSFNIGLSGMRAASKDLNVTGNNIANAGTVGFKQSRAEFADVYAASVLGTGKNPQGSGVLLANVSQQFNQGNINYTQNALDLAINGNGFFQVSNNGAVSYTRAGYFGTDREGFVVDNFGYKLQGYAVDGNGNLQNGVVSDLQVQTTNQAPKASSKIDTVFNLNSTNGSPSAWTSAYEGWLTTNPGDTAGALTAANGTFDPADPTTYNSSTSLNIYDSQGNAHVMTQYFVKTSANTWDMRVLVDGRNPANPSSTDAFDTTLTFDSSGSLQGTTAGDFALNADGTLRLTNWVPAISNGATPAVWSANGAQAATGGITIDLTKSTQFASSFAVNSVAQDGYTTGELAGLEIDDTGVIFARYTNGQSKVQGQIVLANFANVQGLTPVGKSQWVQSFESGEPVVGTPRSGTLGALQAGALEDSNVELSDQLVNLIVAQRNYQANAKTIETESAVTQTIINLR
ncbi:flagellar hook protein FlgE [Pseudomonas oligotrophica]|uniref:flagellar hook protein FlgE n=1 Tax=Pseudomonas oligotrophica TaxID=2912055 RepID=UPI001F36E00B|nr:flagellar hook protein FlgE [Pseudomonas oligotrophica]MCF7202201.1 flagellar hook protein FlgE [Pseudomonas oligotrophica]